MKKGDIELIKRKINEILIFDKLKNNNIKYKENNGILYSLRLNKKTKEEKFFCINILCNKELYLSWFIKLNFIDIYFYEARIEIKTTYLENKVFTSFTKFKFYFDKEIIPILNNLSNKID